MIKIRFTGDIMCYPEMTEKCGKNYAEFFANVKEDLSDSDYTVGNLETPIAGEDMQYTHEPYCFNSPESFLDALKDSGVDMVTLANNHCMDRGEEGIKRTLIACRKRFDTVGLNLTEEESKTVFVKEFGDLKVAFLNYTYGTNAFAHNTYLTHKYMVDLFQPEEKLKGSIHLLESSEFIAEQVKKIYVEKGEGYNEVKPFLDKLGEDIKNAKGLADFVVLLAHCGGQRNDLPEEYTNLIMRTARKYGVDYIVGNHPHIIQKSETVDGVFTSYCLGNFMFVEHDYDNSDIDMNYSVIQNLYLEKRDGKIVQKTTFEIVCLNTDNSLPYPVNACTLYEKTKDENLKEKILFFANRFADRKDYYKEVKKEYEL